ncbi:MAG: preprotein translocase subunit SecY, partial [Gammaproteobacteria bacterium]|nr:preprotein translocase subunit SecY [Gammaproteobacteria bacterium]
MSRTVGITALAGVGKLTELRQRIFFVLGALIVFRIGTFIPLPGIDVHVMEALFDQARGSILDMFNMFSVVALSLISVCAVGVGRLWGAGGLVLLVSVGVARGGGGRGGGDGGRRVGVGGGGEG